MDLAQLFAEKGYEVRTSSGSKQDRESFVRDVFNALANGSSKVVVLSAAVDEDICGDIAANVDEDTLVLRNTDEYAKGKNRGQHIDAATIRARINKYVSEHDEISEPTFGDYVFDGGDMLGFSVK